MPNCVGRKRQLPSSKPSDEEQGEGRSFIFLTGLKRHLMCQKLYFGKTIIFLPVVSRMTSSKYCLVKGINFRATECSRHTLDVYIAKLRIMLFVLPEK